ncbi:MAG TPA: hypothetical protein VEK14_03655, partial [Rhodomicrobium sp.]|nr:hypothetical protein [Rhodomicrobium sp.]
NISIGRRLPLRIGRVSCDSTDHRFGVGMKTGMGVAMIAKFEMQLQHIMAGIITERRLMRERHAIAVQRCIIPAVSLSGVAAPSAAAVLSITVVDTGSVFSGWML